MEWWGGRWQQGEGMRRWEQGGGEGREVGMERHARGGEGVTGRGQRLVD